MTDHLRIVMHRRLREAAEQGSIDRLYELIGRDANILDTFDEISFVDTPLHIAASLGHIPFAKEIMRLRPSFARTLNRDGFTPMHLALQEHHASQNDHALQRNLIQLVHRLLDVDKDLVRVQGREGMTPFHYAAQAGNVKFLTLCLKVCPESIKDVTSRGENVLHITLKYDRVEAFLLVIKWVWWTWSIQDASLLEKKLLCWPDEEGNTLLHVAVSGVSQNLPKVVSSLMDTGLVDIKAKNLHGFTVFDILEPTGGPTLTTQEIEIIKHMLQQPKSTSTLTRVLVDFALYPFQIIERQYVMIRRVHTVVTDEKLNALLVVGALLITVTFQAALTPPKSRQNLFLLLNALTYCLTTLILFSLIPPGLIGIVLDLLLLFLLACFCVSTLVIITHHIIFVVLSALFGCTFFYLFAYLVIPFIMRIRPLLKEFQIKCLRRDEEDEVVV